MAGEDGRSGKVLVVGGASRIGEALRGVLPADTQFVVRGTGARERELTTPNYASLSPSMFQGVECVVNCVGLVRGSAAELQALNVDLPTALAAMAKAAGAGSFIQISSFSVYGAATAIGKATPERPNSAYGHSKLAGDRALLALADTDFCVTSLRLPLVYGNRSDGKLERLLRLWSGIGFLPVPAGDIERAMISAKLAAEIISCLTANPRQGIVLAADPTPFSYGLAQAARPERLRRLAVPGFLVRMAKHAAPALADRLFSDSVLEDGANVTNDFGLPGRLYDDIASMTFRRG